MEDLVGVPEEGSGAPVNRRSHKIGNPLEVEELPFKLPEKARDLSPEMLANMIKLFRHEILTGVAPITVKRKYMYPGTNIFLWLDTRVQDMSEVTFDIMYEYIMELSGDSGHIPKDYRVTIGKLFRWLVLTDQVSPHELLKFQSMKFIQKSAPVFIRPYSKKEIAFMINLIDRRYPYDPVIVTRVLDGKKVNERKFRPSLMNRQHKALFWFLLETGLRIGEAQKLTVDEVSITQDSIYVVGKGNKARTVPYSEHAKHFMREWIAHRALVCSPDEEALWLSFDDFTWCYPISRSGISRWIDIYSGVSRGVRRKGRVVDARWHRFRKTFATNRYNSGLDLETISRILGHANLSTTSNYIGVDEQDVIKRYQENEHDSLKLYQQAIRQAERYTEEDMETMKFPLSQKQTQFDFSHRQDIR